MFGIVTILYNAKQENVLSSSNQDTRADITFVVALTSSIKPILQNIEGYDCI